MRKNITIGNTEEIYLKWLKENYMDVEMDRPEWKISESAIFKIALKELYNNTKEEKGKKEGKWKDIEKLREKEINSNLGDDIK